MQWCIRPDIAFAMSSVSRFLRKPESQHWQAVLQYMKVAIDYSICFSGSPENLETLKPNGFCDFDWTGI
jgi:hypothetical protein